MVLKFSFNFFCVNFRNFWIIFQTHLHKIWIIKFSGTCIKFNLISICSFCFVEFSFFLLTTFVRRPEEWNRCPPDESCIGCLLCVWTQQQNRQGFYRFFSWRFSLTAPAIKCDVRGAIFRNFGFEAASFFIEIPSGGCGTPVKVWTFFFFKKNFFFILFFFLRSNTAVCDDLIGGKWVTPASDYVARVCPCRHFFFYCRSLGFMPFVWFEFFGKIQMPSLSF